MSRKDAIARIGFAIVMFIMQLMLITNAIINIANGTFFPEDNGIRLNNFAISELTDEQVISVTNFSRIREEKMTTSGEASGIEDEEYKESDVDKIEFSCEKIIGIKTLQATRAENCTLVINISSEVISGNMYIVIVSNNSIVEYANVGEDVRLEYTASDAQEYYVKLLCENAKVNASIKRTVIPASD